MNTFVKKYTAYVIFLMSYQIFSVAIIIFGAVHEGYYDFDVKDGQKNMRYVI